MTDPAQGLPVETTAFVTLNAKSWPIPQLVWRDLKKCRKELLELQGLINAAIAVAPADDGGEGAGSRNMAAMGGVFTSLANEDFDRLVMGPLFVGLSAAHPDLTRDELDSWPMTEFDRQLAWLTVRRQSGLFVIREASADDVETDEEPGEATGAT